MRWFSLMAAAFLLACGGGGSKVKADTKEEVAKPPKTQEGRMASSYAGPRIRVAVGKFDELGAAKMLMEKMGWQGIAPLITEQITTGLVQTGRVWVLERAQIKKVIGNTKLESEGDMSKYFDQKTTVDKGKLLGAQAVLVGAVTEFEPNVGGADAGISLGDVIGLKHHTNKAVIGVDVRLVDQETGKVLHAANGKAEIFTHESGLKLGYQGIKFGGGAWSRTPIGKATRVAARNALTKLITGLKKIPWQGKVVQVAGKKVFIDAGTQLNLKKGDRFRVVHRGEAIKGPDGTVLGYDENEGGWIELTSVQEKMSVAKLVDGEAPKTGDVVRFPTQ